MQSNLCMVRLANQPSCGTRNLQGITSEHAGYRMRYRLLCRLSRTINHENARHYDREKLMKHLRVDSARSLRSRVGRRCAIISVFMFHECVSKRRLAETAVGRGLGWAKLRLRYG